MAFTVRTTHRENRKSKSKTSRRRRSLQKPNGLISPCVQKVGGDKFGIVCVDPAKHRSEWMMADYFGNVLIEPQTVKHQAAFFQLAVEHRGRFVLCAQATEHCAGVPTRGIELEKA
jgi:hypothetical protein